MSLQIVPLRAEHLEGAAALVSLQYRALRGRVPLLPARYAEAGAILDLLHGLARETSGVAALRDGRLAGFLLGFVLPNLLGTRSMYSPEWANGAEPGESRRIYEEMYAHASAQWVAAGCHTHAVTLFAHDREGLEGWQWLGFGLASVDALRALEPAAAPIPAVEVRRAGPDDLAAAQALGAALERHLSAAPTFWIHELEDWRVWLENPTNALWLAQRGGEVVAGMGIEFGRAGGCAVVQDERTAGITSAFTREEDRGGGVATALLNRSLEWARAQGAVRCAVDFESMNILASRFWTRWFEPVCFSAIRRVDERVGTQAK